MSSGETLTETKCRLFKLVATNFRDFEDKLEGFQEEHESLFHNHKKDKNYHLRLAKDTKFTKKDLSILVIQLLDHHVELGKLSKAFHTTWSSYGLYMDRAMTALGLPEQEDTKKPTSAVTEEMKKIDVLLANTEVLLLKGTDNSDDKILDDLQKSIQLLQKTNEKQLNKFDLILNNTQELLTKSDGYLNNSKSLENELRSDIKVLFDTSKTFVNYAEAVKSKCPTDTTPQLVRTAIKEEFNLRSGHSNIMLFGLEDVTEKNIHEEVKNVLKSIDVNIDKMEVSMLNSNSGNKLSVKVKLGDEWTAGYILRRAKNLKQTRYSNVFLAPDRSPAERAARRALVQELKEKVMQDKTRRWFIKNGKVQHAPVTAD